MTFAWVASKGGRRSSSLCTSVVRDSKHRLERKQSDRLMRLKDLHASIAPAASTQILVHYRKFIEVDRGLESEQDSTRAIEPSNNSVNVSRSTSQERGT